MVIENVDGISGKSLEQRIVDDEDKTDDESQDYNGKVIKIKV